MVHILFQVKGVFAKDLEPMPASVMDVIEKHLSRLGQITSLVMPAKAFTHVLIT